MTRNGRLMLAEQGPADPELAGCDVHRPADPRDAEIERLKTALRRLYIHANTMSWTPRSRTDAAYIHETVRDALAQPGAAS